MDDLLLSSNSRQRLEAYLRQPSHAVLLLAPEGFGKAAIATALAAKLLDLSPQQLATYAYFTHYAPVKGSITIEMVREIAAFLKLKTTGDGAVRRIVMIEQADTMTTEAQNALLKLIEEPPADTVLILTASTPTRVLSTILSRVQRIALHNPEQATTNEYFLGQGHTEKAIINAYLISGGSVGLMHALLASDTEHPLVHAIAQAKMVLKADQFERLVLIDEIAKEKQTDRLIFALKQTAQAALTYTASHSGQPPALKRWHSVLKATYQAESLSASNTQPKLLLTDLFLSL